MNEKEVLVKKMNELRQVKDCFYENEKCCPNLFNKIGEMVKNNPNDYDLGSEIRKMYLEIKK